METRYLFPCVPRTFLPKVLCSVRGVPVYFPRSNYDSHPSRHQTSSKTYSTSYSPHACIDQREPQSKSWCAGISKMREFAKSRSIQISRRFERGLVPE